MNAENGSQPKIGTEEGRETIRTFNQYGNNSKALFVAITGVMIALETVMTILISIRIPATQGYFNLGEMIIYLAAILFGPIVGFLTGAIGASLADLILGYSIFAPATFIIKGTEGYIVGYLYKRFIKNERANDPIAYIKFKPEISTRKHISAIIISTLHGGALMVVGYLVFEILIGVSIAAVLVEVPVNIIQCLIGAIMTVILAPAIKKVFQN
mgnify:CR=1 FL=1